MSYIYNLAIYLSLSSDNMGENIVNAGEDSKDNEKRIDIVNILCFTLILIPIDLGWGYFAPPLFNLRPV